MESARPVVVGLDRNYDLQLLSALPGALSRFSRAELETQLVEMSTCRRALCFTLMAPLRHPAAANGAVGAADRSVGVVLVCLHVAPEIAAGGLGVLLETLSEAAAADAAPLHELAAPLCRVGDRRDAGFYREAIYEGAAESYIAITTHSPAEIPPEAAATVAQVTKGGPVDVVTTIAVAARRPDAALALRHRRPAARPTYH